MGHDSDCSESARHTRPDRLCELLADITCYIGIALGSVLTGAVCGLMSFASAHHVGLGFSAAAVIGAAGFFIGAVLGARLIRDEFGC